MFYKDIAFIHLAVACSSLNYTYYTMYIIICHWEIIIRLSQWQSWTKVSLLYIYWVNTCMVFRKYMSYIDIILLLMKICHDVPWTNHIYYSFESVSLEMSYCTVSMRIVDQSYFFSHLLTPHMYSFHKIDVL